MFDFLKSFYSKKVRPQNSIMVLYPYLYHDTWVFDDPSVGLNKEAFVAGVPEILAKLFEREKIQHPESGFKLFFSSSPFPNHQLYVTWTDTEYGGNWYMAEFGDGIEMYGWLCPALFKYFSHPPKHLYIKVETIESEKVLAGIKGS